MNWLTNKRNSLAALARNARLVRREFGRPALAQCREIWRLRSVGIGAKDYYEYDLFDRTRFPTDAEQRTYRGWRFREELRHFSHPSLQALAYHKHILYRLLEGWGFPVPRIEALYSPRGDGFEQHRALTTPEQLEDFFRTTKLLPLFGKPSNASHGFGARAFLARTGTDAIQLRSGEALPIRDVVAEIHRVAQRTGTYLLTELLEPAEEFRRLSGPVLPSARIVVLLRGGEPEPFRVAILLPLAHHDVSNARGLTTGSIAGGVDPATGTIRRPISSAGPGMKPAPNHPETGARIEGYRITGFQEILAVVLGASRALAPFRMQHWDVAFTARGPVLLEMNFIGDLEPMQLSGPPGLFSEQFRTFYETHRVW